MIESSAAALVVALSTPPQYRFCSSSMDVPVPDDASDYKKIHEFE